jgi:hypothetical protein
LSITTWTMAVPMSVTRYAPIMLATTTAPDPTVEKAPPAMRAAPMAAVATIPPAATAFCNGVAFQLEVSSSIVARPTLPAEVLSNGVDRKG